MSETVEFKSTTSTKMAPIHLIPFKAIECLAERMQLGADLKGDRAWNLGANYKAPLMDRDFVIDRLQHVVKHAMHAIAALKTDSCLFEDGPWDDAGAIMFGGALLACSVGYLEGAMEEKIPPYTYYSRGEIVWGPGIPNSPGIRYISSEGEISYFEFLKAETRDYLWTVADLGSTADYKLKLMETTKPVRDFIEMES